MSIVASVLLILAVVAAWLGAISFLRLHTALERIHCVTYVSVVTLGALVLAGFATEGSTPRTCKLVLLWVINLAVGALLSHATARAIHLREGEMR
jgi:multisubunit Na+/H+ antiporter MnhG subunit